MNLKSLRIISFFLAVLGLSLICLLSPSQEQNRSSLSCSGQIAVEANISNISVVSDGLIATIYKNKSKMLVFLKDTLAQEGDRISITGKASKFSNQCWIFPERVEVR